MPPDDPLSKGGAAKVSTSPVTLDLHPAPSPAPLAERVREAIEDAQRRGLEVLAVRVCVARPGDVKPTLGKWLKSTLRNQDLVAKWPGEA